MVIILMMNAAFLWLAFKVAKLAELLDFSRMAVSIVEIPHSHVRVYHFYDGGFR
jgi:hypothetical protein